MGIIIEATKQDTKRICIYLDSSGHITKIQADAEIRFNDGSSRNASLDITDLITPSKTIGGTIKSGVQAIANFYQVEAPSDAGKMAIKADVIL